MRRFKKLTALVLALVIMAVPAASSAEEAEDTAGDGTVTEEPVTVSENPEAAVPEEEENASEQEEPADTEEEIQPEEPEDPEPVEPEKPVVKKKTKKVTKVTGKMMKINARARGKIVDTVTITHPGARLVRLQWKNPRTGKWNTLKTFKTKKYKTQNIKITYPNKWWYSQSSKWRILIKGNKGYKQYVSDVIVIKSKRYYQNPSKYYQIHDKVKLSKSGGYTLKRDYMGLKVQKVNSYFGIGDRNWPRYSSTTKSCVKSFQKDHGLKATGNVNKATWMKLGKVRKQKKGSRGYFTEYNWYHLGAYTYPVKIDRTASKKQCIERFIKTAYQYEGSPYVVGASGKASQGADCSGLVMQCMYSCGINPEPISSIRHSRPGYEYESRNMWTSDHLKKVKFSNRKRGDLIFYKNWRGTIIHVGIYLGDDKIIHSWPDKVRVSSVYGWGSIAGARRVFA